MDFAIWGYNIVNNDNDNNNSNIYICIYIFTSWGTFCSSSPEYQPVSNLTHRPSTDHLPENFKEPPAIMACNSMVSTKNNRQQNQPSDRDWYYSKYWAFHGFQPYFFRIFPPKKAPLVTSCGRITPPYLKSCAGDLRPGLQLHWSTLPRVEVFCTKGMLSQQTWRDFNK